MDSTAILYTFLSLFLLFISFNFLTKKGKKLPPSPPFPLPILGHLRLLKPPLHRTFLSLSKKHGPIISLRCGSRLIVVVSSPSIAKECITKHDIVLANRPDFLNAKIVAYNFTTIGTSPYGDHWRNLKRMVGNEVLSSHRLSSFLDIRKDEIKRLLLKLYRSDVSDGFVKVELKSLFCDLTLNNIIRMVSGKRYFGDDGKNEEEASNCKEIMADIVKLSGAGYMADYLPMLNFIGSKYEKKLKNLSKRMDNFLQGFLNEQQFDEKAEKNTMIQHLLSLRQSEPDNYTDETIKGIIQAMLLGGTDTTSTTLDWAMSSLLNNPHILQKAKAHIDSIVGQDRLIDEPDLPNLPYLQNIINETLRIYPTFPLLIPHYSSADCRIAGYDVPRGTILLINMRAIQNDPKVWEHPERFMPERFGTEDKKADDCFKLMAFGLGRRSCPGEGLARRVIGLTLGSLIQCFEWKRLNEEEVIDMSEVGTGLSMVRVEPLNALCKARPIMTKVVGGDVFME